MPIYSEICIGRYDNYCLSLLPTALIAEFHYTDRKEE